MGTLSHGAQLVNKPILVGLVSGTREQTVGQHGFLHPTILKSRRFHRGTGVSLAGSNEAVSHVKLQLQRKSELVIVLAQPPECSKR